MCVLYLICFFISVDYNGIRFRVAVVGTVYVRSMRIISYN
jgi:hypothetical protein